MKRSVVYDVTHLRAKLANATPTGIDQVDLAFARHVAGGDDAPVLAAEYRSGSPKVSGRDAVVDLVRLADRRWSGHADAERELAAVRLWLRDGRRPPPRRSVPFARAAFAINNGILPPLRRFGLGSGLETVPPGALYLNVAQYVAQHDAYFRWLRKRTDVAAVFFIHDLIALDFPEFWAGGYAEIFSRRIDTIFGCAKAVVVASEAVRDRVAAERARRGHPPIPILASPLPVPAARPIACRDAGLAAAPYFVMLGTIEPRKNHHLILAAWRRLVARGGLVPKLLIIGRRGWRTTHVVDILERCEALRPHVLELADLSSAAIDQVLAGARALLMPSFAEGFGLPIVEALRGGTPVVASDLPVFREAAQGKALFRDPIDGVGWSEAVEALCDERSPLALEARRLAGTFSARSPADYFAEVDAFLADL